MYFLITKFEKNCQKKIFLTKYIMCYFYMYMNIIFWFQCFNFIHFYVINKDNFFLYLLFYIYIWLLFIFNIEKKFEEKKFYKIKFLKYNFNFKLVIFKDNIIVNNFDCTLWQNNCYFEKKEIINIIFHIKKKEKDKTIEIRI